jgi:hypothetical protein
MSLLDICQWINDTQASTALRQSLIMFPLIETIHVLGLAGSVGLILMVDLRLIGVNMKRAPFTTVFHQLEPISLWGFGAMFISGILLFCSEAAKLYHSGTFIVKLIFLVGAGINMMYFNKGIYRKVATWDKHSVTPPKARLAGWLSIILWMGVIGFGRWTAYGLG